MDRGMTMLFDANITPQGPVYEYVRNAPECAHCRTELEALWKKYEPYADKGFVSKIANDFYSHFWEMYLACALMDTGFKLIPRSKLSPDGPDICIQADQSRIWVEATAPERGTGDDAVPDSDSHQTVCNQEDRITPLPAIRPPEERILLRYLNAISTKFEQYQRCIEKGHILKTEPYIIAVCNRKIPFVWDHNLPDEPPYIVKAVLPLGLETAYFNPDMTEIIGQDYEFRPEITKVSGAGISTKVGLMGRYKGISAFVSSSVDYDSDYHKLGSDFILLHNPMAANPLPSGWLRRGHEYWVESDNQDKILRMQKWGH